MNPIQPVRLIALLSSIAGSASAQIAPPAPAPAPAPAVASEAPAPAVAPPAPAPVVAPEAPAPAVAPEASAPVVLATAPTDVQWPPPPAPPNSPSRDHRGRFMVGGAWNVAFPLGSVHHFTSAVSGLGFEFLVRYFACPQLSIGASTDFQTFIQTRPRTTYQVDHGALTATAYNSVQNTAVRASAHYYFLQNGPVLPYLGASVGLGWSTFQTAAADLAIYDNQTSILLGGDLGALFPLVDSNLAFLFAARYSALPSADFLQVTNVQSLTLQVGLLTL